MAFEGINWGLAAPVDVGGAVQQGFERGQQMRRETDTRNALAAYGANPSRATANALLPLNPQIGMQAGQQVAAQEAAQKKQMLMQRVAQGDHGALDELAGVDPDLWMKMDDRTREQIKKATGFMGQAVLDVGRLPEDQRAAAWAHYVQQAEASGLDIPTNMERYSPEALNAAAAEAGTMEKLIKRFEPDWHFSPNGGLVDFNNPQSIQQYGQWMGGQAPGQGTVPPPPPGFQIDGGPTPSASGGFR